MLVNPPVRWIIQYFQRNLLNCVSVLVATLGWVLSWSRTMLLENRPRRRFWIASLSFRSQKTVVIICRFLLDFLWFRRGVYVMPFFGLTFIICGVVLNSHLTHHRSQRDLKTYHHLCHITPKKGQRMRNTLCFAFCCQHFCHASRILIVLLLIKAKLFAKYGTASTFSSKPSENRNPSRSWCNQPQNFVYIFLGQYRITWYRCKPNYSLGKTFSATYGVPAVSNRLILHMCSYECLIRVSWIFTYVSSLHPLQYIFFQSLFSLLCEYPSYNTFLICL